MYLKSIKLSGFKSFVDTTVIPIRAQMNAVVGPNGCGKSNVVDAIRWVVGETSAKQLRGQSMSDVIFNGTTTRKPVGKAMVELHFDNSEGRIGGEYAGYNEVAVRREVTRDGQSAYFINNTQCRRRDVIDVFLGTGLGPRSYAIIEQGMISQLIEAKPQDLRVYFEEAAGISKYKERRRETENRIRHTNENLDRLNDLLEELDKQMRHLKRQANAAERYQTLKAEQRLLLAQIKALQWSTMQNELQRQEQEITEQGLAQEAALADKRAIETDIEKTRLTQQELNEQLNQAQKNYYSIGSEIARIEQRIKYNEEQTERWSSDLEEADSLWQEIIDSCSEHREQVAELAAAVNELTPRSEDIQNQTEEKQMILTHAEADMEHWQGRWDDYQRQNSQAAQQAEVTRTKITHHEQQIANLKERISRLQTAQEQQSVQALTQEIAPLNQRSNELDYEIAQIRDELESLTAQIKTAREQTQTRKQTVEQKHGEVRELQTRHAELQAIQQSALSGDDEKLNEWLQAQGLADKPRLGKQLRVSAGWEQAVETVLSGYFNALCVDNVGDWASSLETVTQGQLTLLDKHSGSENTTAANTLAQYVQSDWPVASWLANIRVAENLAEAMSMRTSLTNDESIITRDGMWVGANWLRVAKPVANDSGVIQREKDIEQTAEQLAAKKQELAELEQALMQGEQHVKELEAQREQAHQTHQQKNSEWTQAQTALSAKQSRLEELQQQQTRLANEIGECQQQVAGMEQALENTRSELNETENQQNEIAETRSTLESERMQVAEQLDAARKEALLAEQRLDEMAIRLSANESQLSVLKQTLARDERQLTQLESRRENLNKQLSEVEEPLRVLREELQTKLGMRVNTEQVLRTAEEELNTHNQHVDQIEKQRQSKEVELGRLNESIQALQMQKQTVVVRQSTLQEQVQETEFTMETLLEEMPAEANVKTWEENAERATKRIDRLGPINLAAIDEYKTVSERKEYLDKQQADLLEALQVLESAIQKIDRETRSRFRETFEKANERFQQLFPKIFGGGSASLDLSEDDLLTAGVVVRAQPPGKRNSTIHMLSGGEKALTAISLLFSLFQLNPAPFCILDEVDAPLDDLNVSRYCALVKEMSKDVQFIVISHNKVTIEAADSLMGVTMQEAGVSRVVSVDMAEAIAMVE